MMETSDAKDLAQIIWDYMRLDQPPRKADAIVALGSHDLRVAERAAGLYLQGYAPLLICSGALGRVTGGTFGRPAFKKPEAQLFADIALKKGVPKNKILIENQSTNTGENIQFVRQLLKNRNLKPKTLLLVHTPYMERRTYATMKQLWPEQDFVVTSTQLSFDQYFGTVTPNNRDVQVMVGDLQRIKLYAAKGYQTPQEIPDKVWQAYEMLKVLGYDTYVL